MSRLWERLRGSSPLRGGFLFLVVAVIVAAAAVLPTTYESPLADTERLAFDLQMRALREISPRPVAADVVLVGIDDATEEAFPEPKALWHRHFANAYHALARAKPLAVGVDIVLPERSFDAILPGSDLALMRGLLDLRRSTALVLVQTVNTRGELVAVQANLGGIIGPQNLGVDQQLRDPDSVSRVFSERQLSRTEQPVPSFAGQLLRAIGRQVQEGAIDYSLGAPIEYVPLHELIAMDAPSVAKRVAGRVVLVGSLIREVDRWRLPVKLLARDPGAAVEDGKAGRGGSLTFDQPGVLVHLQVLRNHFASGLLRPVPEAVRWLLLALAMLAVMVSARPMVVLALAIAVPAALACASLAAIVYGQLLLPLASMVAAFWLALVARGVFDAVEATIDRLRLRQSFAGQVSPAVMKEMLGGTLTPGVSGQLADVCVLFSDVRDFTTLSEKMPPEVVTTVLQRYFDPAGISPADRAAFEKRAARIGEKLNAAKGRHPVSPPAAGDAGSRNGAAMGRALRISTELIGAIVVGGAIGWALDRWIGNEKPWFFILFFMLGAAAGILNVVRAAAKETTPPAPSVRDEDEER